VQLNSRTNTSFVDNFLNTEEIRKWGKNLTDVTESFSQDFVEFLCQSSNSIEETLEKNFDAEKLETIFTILHTAVLAEHPSLSSKSYVFHIEDKRISTNQILGRTEATLALIITLCSTGKFPWPFKERETGTILSSFIHYAVYGITGKNTSTYLTGTSTKIPYFYPEDAYYRLISKMKNPGLDLGHLDEPGVVKNINRSVIRSFIINLPFVSRVMCFVIYTIFFRKNDSLIQTLLNDLKLKMLLSYNRTSHSYRFRLELIMKKIEILRAVAKKLEDNYTNRIDHLSEIFYVCDTKSLENYIATLKNGSND